MALIRGTALAGFPDLMADLGGDADQLLAAAGIPRESVGSQDAYVSYRRGIDLLEMAATSTATPDFGRRLALRQGVEILGPVGVAARTAPTVGAAFRALSQYLSVYSPAISSEVRLDPERERASVDFDILLTRLGPHAQAVELALGVLLQICRLLIGPDFRPILVELRHRPLTATQDYTRYFGCPVRFGQPTSSLVIRQSDLARPLASDGPVHAIVNEYLSTIVSPSHDQTAEAVRRLIFQTLPTGGLTIEVIASHFGQHARTLQRHLASQGTSFADLVDEVRRAQLEHYLRDTDLPLGQLAGLLGYSEQSVLSRSCRRWYAMTPSEYRRASRLTAGQPAEG